MKNLHPLAELYPDMTELEFGELCDSIKSVGLAVEDLAAALHVYEKAKQRNDGTHLILGGRRHAAH